MNIPARLLLLTSALFASTAQATTFYIDNFEITRDNQTIFNDPFCAMARPRVSGTHHRGKPTIISLAHPLFRDPRHGKLELDSADGEAINSTVGGVPILLQFGRVLTPQAD